MLFRSEMGDQEVEDVVFVAFIDEMKVDVGKGRAVEEREKESLDIGFGDGRKVGQGGKEEWSAKSCSASGLSGQGSSVFEMAPISIVKRSSVFPVDLMNAPIVGDQMSTKTSRPRGASATAPSRWSVQRAGLHSGSDGESRTE